MTEHGNVYGIGHDTQAMEDRDLNLNHTQTMIIRVDKGVLFFKRK